MDIKQEPLDDSKTTKDDSKTTTTVKTENDYHYDEDTNVTGLGSYDLQHMTIKEETLDIDEKPVLTSIQDESVKMKCATCGQVYNLKQSFIERARINAAEESFRCTFCEYKMGEIHACNFCSYKTNALSGLVYHMLIHTGEKPFACSFCDYRSMRKGSLVVHMRKHTGEKSYKSGPCSFKTSHAWKIKYHKKK